MNYNDQKAVAKAHAMASEMRRELEERGLEQIICHHVSPTNVRFTAFNPKKKKMIESHGVVREDAE